MSVRLSVRPSVCHTPVFWRNGLSPSSRHTILHFALPNIMAVFRRGPPDVECTVGMKKLRFSTNISLYPRNDTKYGHSYYRMRIENCTQTFKWYHFQWFWVTLNPDFRVTPLLDAEYLRNGTRYRHSFNRIQIVTGTYTRRTQRCYFEWPPVTLSDLV